jgi:hypothetical protein
MGTLAVAMSCELSRHPFKALTEASSKAGLHNISHSGIHGRRRARPETSVVFKIRAKLVSLPHSAYL